MSRVPLLAVLLAATLAVAGCGHRAAAEPADPLPDARVVLDAMAASGLPLTHLATTTADTDPNAVLGTAGAYVSRAAADVPQGDPNAVAQCVQRGLVIEVWATDHEVTDRVASLDMALMLGELPVEHHFRPDDKRILVRLTGKVPDSEAERYDEVVANLDGGPSRA
ncbi:hypothetical protein [Micromonospora sp. DT227]|uniref:hypothetical protein n=1 Tax=Micromonospora sp. DT227 TaxID=3393433 RepID=UPI003CF0B1A7